MTNLKEIHQTASFYMQAAIVAQAQGEIQESLHLFEQAFEAEKQAALLLLGTFDNEPTRSVLFRSAAVLALDCKKYAEAKKMIYLGLAGNPSQEIIDELTELYEQVHQEMKLVEIPTFAVPKNPNAQNYFWLNGILKTADAQKHKITIVSEDNKTASVTVPKGLGHIVRNYWDENVRAYILKQGKQLTLVKIDKTFMQKTA